MQWPWLRPPQDLLVVLVVVVVDSVTVRAVVD